MTDASRRRQEWRERCLPVGFACEVHDGTRATVPGVVEENTGVLIRVRLRDGRTVFRYDHEVFSPADGVKGDE